MATVKRSEDLVGGQYALGEMEADGGSPMAR